jgi:CheY-like chemotaxis protein
LQHDADFSAAVFDMMMPHLLGMDLIHYMKTDARLSHIPIGMITAEQDPKSGTKVSPPERKYFFRNRFPRRRFK